MKIAVDFDDVIVDTMVEFLKTWNKTFHGDDTVNYLTRNRVNNWNLPDLLNVPVGVIKEIYASIEYALVPEIYNAAATMNRLRRDGHELVVLSANPDYKALRRKLNMLGLQKIRLQEGIGHKAGWCRDNNIDVMVEDRPKYLKGCVTVGVHAIRFIQQWNRMPGGFGNPPYEHNAHSWAQVYQVIQQIDRTTPVGPKSPKDFFLKVGDRHGALVTGPTPMPDFPNAGPVVGQTVTNAKGAKQSHIAGRYDLLPHLAVKEVAKVLAEGAEKYGEDNWKDLGIDEILNHVYNHTVDYLVEANTEDLSHAACRILMALQLQIEAEREENG